VRNDIQTGLAEAFDTDLADAVQAFSAERVTVSDVLDPVTGTYPEVVVTYQGRGVFDAYSAEEIGQHIEATDLKLIALQNELTDTPQVDDIIEGMRVMVVQQDPAGASWELQLRAT